MKSGWILTLVVIAALAAPLKAEEPGISFDGAGAVIPKAADVQALGQLSGGGSAEAVEVEMPGRPAPDFSREQLSEMDKSIESAISYINAKGGDQRLAAGFGCLLRQGTPEQKFMFVYQVGGEYSLPENCVMRGRGSFTEGCKWVFDRVCNTITYMACAIMADGSKECHEEAKEDCKVVKECIFS